MVALLYSENPNAISLTVHRTATIVPTHRKKAFQELIHNYKGIRKYFDYNLPLPYLIAFDKLVDAYLKFTFMHLSDEENYIRQLSEKQAINILKENLEKLKTVFRGDDPSKYIPELNLEKE